AALTPRPPTAALKSRTPLLAAPAGTRRMFESPDCATNPDGSVSVTLSGSLPVGIAPQPATIAVPSPTKFAETVFREALSAAGIQIKNSYGSSVSDFYPY